MMDAFKGFTRLNFLPEMFKLFFNFSNFAVLHIIQKIAAAFIQKVSKRHLLRGSVLDPAGEYTTLLRPYI